MKITRVEPILVRTPLKFDDAQQRRVAIDLHRSRADHRAARVMGRDASQIAPIQADLLEKASPQPVTPSSVSTLTSTVLDGGLSL